jgi:hypothetical protein
VARVRTVVVYSVAIAFLPVTLLLIWLAGPVISYLHRNDGEDVDTDA